MYKIREYIISEYTVVSIAVQADFPSM